MRKVAAIGTAVALAGLTLPAAAAATAPASQFDAPGQLHATVCAPLASPRPALRFGDGAATGFRATGRGACGEGAVRLDLHEVIPSPAGSLVFNRGGQRHINAANVKYGAISVSDIAGPLPAAIPSGGGRGAPCALSSEAPYQVSVQSIPKAMHYKRPQDLSSGSNRGSSLSHYGDPGSDQGTVHGIHYSYLLWSFVDVHGGGEVRTLLSPGQVVRACDVAPITMPAWDRSGAVNGSVTARYVRVLAGSCPVYGWMAWSHSYFRGGAGAVAHAVPLRSAAPPEPAVDPRCPVAAPASGAVTQAVR